MGESYWQGVEVYGMRQRGILLPSDMRVGLTQKPVTLKNSFALVQRPHVWLFAITLFLHTDFPLKVRQQARKQAYFLDYLI
ncbi:hypothetical protein QLZ26_15440 [Cronobacter universalis]|uniref:hypothetical protein n=1 Tax=Cronobacter universalis TaxID=535744 RepID=UPI0024AEC1AE|nr:hypothetical protein [Cronobacter universalis]MDI7661497.1 hypothetical protein [Cronobacter universalis]